MSEELPPREQIVGSHQLMPNLGAVAPALSALGASLKERGLTDQQWTDVELAVAEGLNNAIEHGCAGREGHPEPLVGLNWRWDATGLHIDITDPSDYQPPVDLDTSLPVDPLDEGGRGHFLIDQLCDEFRHELVNGRHRLHLTKRINPPPMG